MERYKIDGHPGLTKDPQSGVIHNANRAERQAYRIAKKQANNGLETQAELLKLKREVRELGEVKEELKELKELLKDLLNK